MRVQSSLKYCAVLQNGCFYTARNVFRYQTTETDSFSSVLKNNMFIAVEDEDFNLSSF